MQTELDPQKTPANSPDRRRHPRYRFSVPMTIRSAEGSSIPGISIEISESGISAITADPLSVNGRTGAGWRRLCVRIGSP